MAFRTWLTVTRPLSMRLMMSSSPTADRSIGSVPSLFSNWLALTCFSLLRSDPLDDLDETPGGQPQSEEKAENHGDDNRASGLLNGAVVHQRPASAGRSGLVMVAFSGLAMARKSVK